MPTEQDSMALTAQSFADYAGNEHVQAVSACLDALAAAKVRMAEARAREVRKLLRATTMNKGPT